MLQDLYSEEMTSNKKLEKNKGQVLTPPEIVDYMVEESVKASLENKKEGESLQILDPASGTGRFMLGVADYCWKNKIDFLMWNIDIDEKMFDACRNHAKHYKIPAIVILGDALLNRFEKAVACKDGVEQELNVKDITEMFEALTAKSSGNKSLSQSELF